MPFNFFGGWDAPTFSQDRTPAEYQDYNQIYNTATNGVNANQNAQAAQLNLGPQNQFRQDQLNQINQLQGIASGTQQGAGELAAQRQTQNALAGQQAMARSVRGGGNAGMAYQNAANNAAGIGLAGAGQAQQAALQDQMNAQGLLSGALNTGRGQDIGIANSNANLTQQQQSINNQGALGYLSQLTGMDANQLQAQLGLYQNQQSQPGLLGGLLNAGGQVGAAYFAGHGRGGQMTSDKRAKKNITTGHKEIDDMLNAIKPYKYSYRDKKHGEGPRVGIMAQDMEKSKIGKYIVGNDNGTKVLDINKALSASLAGLARVNERLNKITKK